MANVASAGGPDPAMPPEVPRLVMLKLCVVAGQYQLGLSLHAGIWALNACEFKKNIPFEPLSTKLSA